MSLERKITTVVASNETSAAWLALTLHQQASTKGVNPQGFINALDRVIARSLWKEKAATLEEFLSAPYPDGAGISRKLLEQVLKIPFTHQLEEVEREVEAARLRILEAIAPKDNRDNNGQHLKEWDRDHLGKAVNPNSYHNDKNLGSVLPPIAETRTKAVSRAPRIARDLYSKDCLGLQEAVKLGPRVNSKKPTAEQLAIRAKADEAGAKLERWVELNPIPVRNEDRPKYKRQANAVVREWMSEPSLVAATWKTNATANDIATAILRKVPVDMLSEVIQLLTDRSRANE
jgi:hypothetical protein